MILSCLWNFSIRIRELYYFHDFSCSYCMIFWELRLFQKNWQWTVNILLNFTRHFLAVLWFVHKCNCCMLNWKRKNLTRLLSLTRNHILLKYTYVACLALYFVFLNFLVFCVWWSNTYYCYLHCDNCQTVADLEYVKIKYCSAF